MSNGIVLDFGSDVSPAGTIELEDTAQLRVDQIIRLGSGRLSDPVNGTVPDGIYLGPTLAALGANYVDGGGALIVGTGGALPAFTVTTLADELDTPVGAGAGLSLREALGLAVLGRIEFAPALDGGTIQLDAARGPLAVRASLTIDASALPSGLIIDGGSNGDNVHDAVETRCLLIDDGNADNLLQVVLRGLTVQNGVFTTTNAEAGGNIHNREQLTLENCRVLGGRALGTSARGGGIFSAPGSRLAITDCTLSGNRTTSSGGAVYFESEANFNSATLGFAMSGSTVSDNFSGSQAGGLFVGTFGVDNGGLATIATSTISGNSATSSGGGIIASGITLRMTATTVANNAATNTSASGGGIIFIGNAIFSDSLKPLVMTNCTVVGNTAGRDGAGLFHAGPIAASGQRSRFTSCTITGNRTTARDGGGFINVNGSQLDLVNSIVAGNTAAGTGPDIDGGFNSRGVNFVGLTSGSSGFRNGTDRSFANTGSTLATLLATTTADGTTPAPLLADNGGPTPTVLLVAGSPANNAGDNTSLPADAETDQRGPGFPRIREGRVDLGAIEARFPVVMVTANKSWLDAVTWSDGAAPTSAHDYELAVVGDNTLRTSPAGQTDAGSANFPGFSLTVPATTRLLLKQADNETASIRAGAGDLIVDGGTIVFGTTSNTRVNTPRLDVNDFHVTATPGALLTLNVAAQTATIDGRLTGPGDLRIEAEGDATLPGHTAVFTAVDEDGYAGTITVAESLVLDFETNVFFRAGGGVTLLGASRLRVDQLLAFRVGRLVDPVNGPVPAGVYLPGQLAALGANYIDAGGAIVVSDHLGDTDADGLPDFFELFIIDADPADAVDGLDDVAGPLSATETDFDQDGLSDAEEFLAGPTIPTDPDSDDDGLLDGAEIAGTDNDGNPTGAGPTHPLRPDTDGDGFSDGEEVAAGTDPNDSESRPAPREIVAVSIVPTVVNGVITRMDITYKNLDTTRTYYIERSLDLVNYDAIVDTHAPATETDTYSDANPPASGRVFYRLVLQDDNQIP